MRVDLDCEAVKVNTFYDLDPIFLTKPKESWNCRPSQFHNLDPPQIAENKTTKFVARLTKIRFEYPSWVFHLTFITLQYALKMRGLSDEQPTRIIHYMQREGNSFINLLIDIVWHRYSIMTISELNASRFTWT